jgi:hypothetical protein
MIQENPKNHQTSQKLVQNGLQLIDREVSLWNRQKN